MLMCEHFTSKRITRNSLLPSLLSLASNTTNQEKLIFQWVLPQKVTLMKHITRKKKKICITMFVSHDCRQSCAKEIHTRSANLNSKCKLGRQLKVDTELHSIQTKQERNDKITLNTMRVYYTDPPFTLYKTYKQ